MRLSTETRPRLRQFVAALRERTRRAVDRHLPDRQIILRTDRRVRAVVLTQRVQLWALTTVAAFLVWSSYATISVAFHGAILAAKDREIGTVRLANAALREQMQEAEDRFAMVTSRLEAKHAYLMKLLERTEVAAPAKSSNGKSRSKGASADRLTQSRKAVREELTQLDHVLSADPEDIGASGEVLRDRASVLAESGRLRARLGTIEVRLGELQLAQQSTMTRLAHRALSNLDQVKDMIAGLGLDADRVLGRGRARAPKGVGGPFIPLSAAEARGAIPASVGSTDSAVARWEGVQRALKLLPLGAPVDHVAVTSGFGRRIDPFNGLPAFHSGLDLSGAMGTPIHATAPGRVTYVGTNGGYGRMVEIDHGHGLVTRYAHLSRFLVRRGDRVHYRQVIGLMGATGRATGVHVHYEVLVNGKPRDPTKFIEAGSYVLVQR